MRAAALRLAVVAGVSGCALMFAAPAMAASTGKVRLAHSAWFTTTVANQVGAPASAPVTEPTGVPRGDDAVAFTEDQSGASSKETLLQFVLPSNAAASTVTTFTVSVRLDPSPTAPQAGAQGSPIVACLPTRGWSSGEGQDSTGEPTVDCTHAVAGVWKGDTVSFAISKLAQSWIDDTNLGVALVNDPTNKTQPFQAVFGGGKQVTATMTYVPAAPHPTTTSRPHHQGAQQPVAPHQSTQSDGTTTTVPSVPTTNFPTGNAGGSTISTGPGDAQPPEVANPESTGQAATATAASAAAAGHSSVPPKGFWLAAASGLILLLGAALALEDQHVAAPSTRRGRLDRLLHDPTRLAHFTTRSQP